MDKRPPVPSNHSPPFKSPHFHTPLLTPTQQDSVTDYVPPPKACSIFSLEWASPLPGLQSFYLSFILQSMSKCLFPNPHLPLALAGSVAPTGLCFHYNIDPSGLQIIVCCLSHEMISSLRTGSLLLIWGFPMPSDNILLQNRRFCLCCWILLKGFTETQGTDFQQLFTLVCKTN